MLYIAGKGPYSILNRFQAQKYIFKARYCAFSPVSDLLVHFDGTELSLKVYWLETGLPKLCSNGYWARGLPLVGLGCEANIGGEDVREKNEKKKSETCVTFYTADREPL